MGVLECIFGLKAGELLVTLEAGDAHLVPCKRKAANQAHHGCFFQLDRTWYLVR